MIVSGHRGKQLGDALPADVGTRSHFGAVPRPSKRFLAAADVDDIVRRYGASDTTGQIGAVYGISKTRVATVLRDQGIAIRRQGLTEDQIDEAVRLYSAGQIVGVYRLRSQHVPHNRRRCASEARCPAATATGLDLTRDPTDELQRISVPAGLINNRRGFAPTLWRGGGWGDCVPIGLRDI